LEDVYAITIYNTMKYFSLFSGIGGFELAIKQAHESLCNVDGSEDGGEQKNSSYDERQRFLSKERKNVSTKDRWSCECSPDGIDERPLCIGYSEIDKYAIQIYEKHFSHKNFGDITKINADTLPDFDFLCGGFPCQAFSIAGLRRGFDDTRGTLFFDIARILRKKQPKLFLLENVKGLLSHDGGTTFKVIVSTLDELGYDLQWQVLNSKNFGVPQNRERVFIFGHLRGTPRPEIFPVRANGKADIVIPTLTARYTAASNGGYVRHRQTHQINDPVHSNDRIYATDGISPTLNTAQGGNRQPKIVGGLQAHQKPREDGISPTLTTAMGMGGGQTPIVWRKDIKIRRLTPKECERLQGFPDGWTKIGMEGKVSDTQRYKCIGNAVTVTVIKEIVYQLM
jgi:DNA (cytosine-5)-methyltransferase 1